MQAIKNKLKSKRGASISFGLMLFLVCAVASSIIIVAATAASGRMAQIAEMDQRYYAVTSAVELLCNDIGEQEVEVTFNPSTGDVTGHENATIIEDASDKLIEALYKKNEMELQPKDKVLTRKLKLEADLEIDNLSLDCEIAEVLRRNGLLYFYVNNGPLNKPTYVLRVIFASNIQETAVISDSTTTTKLSWKLHSIKKMRADSDSDMKEYSEVITGE